MFCALFTLATKSRIVYDMLFNTPLLHTFKVSFKCVCLYFYPKTVSVTLPFLRHNCCNSIVM